MERKIEQPLQETSIPENKRRKNPSLTEDGQRRVQGGDQTTPLSQDDKAQMTIDFSQLQPETQKALQAQGITSTSIANDHTQGEPCTRTILEREGIPDGNGGMEKVKRIVPGTYNDIHGIDLIGVSHDGHPIPIEVKTQAQYAKLSEKSRAESRLEPEVLQTKRDREQDLLIYRDKERERLRLLHEREKDGRQKLDSDYISGLSPHFKQQLTQKEKDLTRSQPDAQDRPRLPVEQMDELWVKDRYIKLLRRSGGAERLQSAGISPEYCQVENLVHGGRLKDTPLWDDILSKRTTVIVGPADAPRGRTMFKQAVFEKKSKRVLRIAI
jgi:hypothetical protein